MAGVRSGARLPDMPLDMHGRHLNLTVLDQIGAGVALIGVCLAAWIFVLAVEAQAISDDTAFGKAMAARHPVTKLFGRKPKAHREL